MCLVRRYVCVCIQSTNSSKTKWGVTAVREDLCRIRICCMHEWRNGEKLFFIPENPIVWGGCIKSKNSETEKRCRFWDSGLVLSPVVWNTVTSLTQKCDTDILQGGTILSFGWAGWIRIYNVSIAHRKYEFVIIHSLSKCVVVVDWKKYVRYVCCVLLVSP